MAVTNRYEAPFKQKKSNKPPRLSSLKISLGFSADTKALRHSYSLNCAAMNSNNVEIPAFSSSLVPIIMILPATKVLDEDLRSSVFSSFSYSTDGVQAKYSEECSADKGFVVQQRIILVSSSEPRRRGDFLMKCVRVVHGVKLKCRQSQHRDTKVLVSLVMVTAHRGTSWCILTSKMFLSKYMCKSIIAHKKATIFVSSGQLLSVFF